MSPKNNLAARIDQHAKALNSKLKKHKMPKLAVILGSGFKQVVGELDIKREIDLSSIKGMPVPRIAGHGQSLLLTKIGGRDCVIVTGRVHMYEGFSAHDVAHTIRVLARCGVEGVLLTNAAGGLHQGLSPGDILAVRDQANLTGQNCLIGEAHALGKQFVDMTQCFDAEWLQVLLGLTKGKSGVYIGTMGPTYETPAETKLYASLGGDVIGMSTVQEVIAARQLGLRVGCLSFVTNLCGGLSKDIDHQHVLDIGKQHQETLKKILRDAIRQLPL